MANQWDLFDLEHLDPAMLQGPGSQPPFQRPANQFDPAEMLKLLQISPEALQAIQQGRAAQQESHALDARMQNALAMQSAPIQQHSSPGGALFGGLGDAFRQIAGKRQADRLGVEQSMARQKIAAGDEATLQHQTAGQQFKAAVDLRGQAAEEKHKADQIRIQQQNADTASRQLDLGKYSSSDMGIYDTRSGDIKVPKPHDPTKGNKDALDRAEALRREYLNNPVTKATQEVASAYAKMQEAARSPSAAGDMSLIYGFMRMQDPGSTVREGEFASAQNASGVPDQIRSMYNRALSGERLAPNVRTDFLGQAGGLYRAQIGRFTPLADNYKRLATQAGIPPEDVALDLGFAAPPAAPRAAPAGPAALTSKAEYDQLPSGATYTAPDGSTRRKK